MKNINQIIKEEINRFISKECILEYLDTMTSNAMHSLGAQDNPSDLAKRTYRYLRRDSNNPQKGVTGIQKNSWLIHITNLETGYKIMKEGFKSDIKDLKFRATQDIEDRQEKTGNGFCFACELDDTNAWGCIVDWFEENGYEWCGIIFQANGFNTYTAFGYGMNEVVFNVNTAHNLLMLVPMSESEQEDYLKYNPQEFFYGAKIIDKNGKVLRKCNMYEFFEIKNPYKFKSAENPAMGEEWLDNASVQYRNSFANKTNNAIKEAIQEVVNELGPRNLGMLAGRRWVNGESDSDIIDHVRKNGGNISDYALGKVEYMAKNPGEVAKRVAKKVHDAKNK